MTGINIFANELAAKRLELGLHRLPHTRFARTPRMADFALWATACGQDMSRGNSRVGSTFRLEKKLEQNRLEQTGEKA